MNFPEIKKPETEIPVEENKNQTSSTIPDFDGLVGCVYSFIGLELMAGIVLLVWSIFTLHGSFALATLLFSGTNLLKAFLMEYRNAAARWLAILAYFCMWWFNPELLRSPDGTQPYPVLQSIISWWCIIFGVLYLFCFNFSKQMREAPPVKV